MIPYHLPAKSDLMCAQCPVDLMCAQPPSVATARYPTTTTSDQLYCHLLLPDLMFAWPSCCHQASDRTTTQASTPDFRRLHLLSCAKSSGQSKWETIEQNLIASTFSWSVATMRGIWLKRLGQNPRRTVENFLWAKAVIWTLTPARPIPTCIVRNLCGRGYDIYIIKLFLPTT